MISRIFKFMQQYWIEFVLIPPSIFALCYFLYGAQYFASASNFLSITFPWLISSTLSSIACHGVRKYTMQRFNKLEQWPKRILWSFCGFLLITVGFAKITYSIIAQVHYANFQADQKDFFVLLLVAAICVLFSATLYEGVTYFEKWKAAMLEAEQLEKLSLETQFQSLQSQLNPHFLFNSFNVLSSLITENPRKAEDFVDELSNVYRYLLRSNEQETASLKEEMRFARSFFHLLETRHETGITLETKISPTLLNKRLPALALQILLENAVKHNEINAVKPLQIEIFERGNSLVVRNNLQPKKTRVASNQIGLSNLSQRYGLLGIPGFSAGQSGKFFEAVLPLF
jgi:sensor histidine kinase YesM